jgi:hypothetical protein
MLLLQPVKMKYSRMRRVRELVSWKEFSSTHV